LWLVVAIVLSSFSIIAAQEDQGFEGFMHGIRANAVNGDVNYRRNDAKFPLEPGLKLEKGDFIETSPNAHAELLLQPGNYLRVAGDTELQIINDEHDRMRLKLNRGTVTIEILSKENLGSFYSSYEARYLIRLLTPDAAVFMGEPGVFRISATPNRPTELIVRNGSAVMSKAPRRSFKRKYYDYRDRLQDRRRFRRVGTRTRREFSAHKQGIEEVTRLVQKAERRSGSVSQRGRRRGTDQQPLDRLGEARNRQLRGRGC
jgi:hypothetical protein